MFMPLILLSVSFALLIAVLMASAAIAVLRKMPVLFGLLLALAGAGAVAGFAALKRRRGSMSAARQTVNWTTSRRSNERNDAADVRRLAEEVADLLKTSPISAQQKADLREQTRRVPENTLRAVSKLQRLHRLKDIARRHSDEDYAARIVREIEELEAGLQAQLKHMRRTLLDISVALMRVDLARDDYSLDRLMRELSATNQRLNDLADGYADVRAERAYQ
jgi:hypothetical protein